jgi:hypothetical protein
MNIQHIINTSFNNAIKSMVMGTSPQSLTRARERVWIKTLSTHLTDALDEDDIRLFSAYNRGNTDHFGTEQLLYDIQVCRVGLTTTADKKKDELHYIQASLWQIETDFSREIHQAVYAFNRLVTGNGENKLFIGAQLKTGRDTTINTLKVSAVACSGNTYLALIPHPEDWEDDNHSIDVWQFTDGDWGEIS